MRRTLLATTLAVLAGCSESLERSFIYYPSRRLEATPREVGLPFEDVAVESEDGVRLHGWYVPGPRGVVLLFAHGNAGNISHRVDNLRRLHARLGLSVLIFDYRGYGASAGTPSEAGLYRDARAFRAWLRRRDPEGRQPVVYFGRSLGAAVAATLGEEDPPAALILESPFVSVPAMASATIPGAGRLFRTRFDTVARVARVRAPLLVLHGDSDEVVPFRQGRAVFEAAPGPKAFFAIPGARHNDTYLAGGGAYWATWERFLETHVPGWDRG